jgi:hypothetical protein
VKTYDDLLADEAARIRAADEAARAAATDEERRAAEHRALDLRADYCRALAVGWLGRGRPIPGMPLAVMLSEWLRTYGDAIGAERVDALIARLGGTIERRTT